ncbi:MAG: hypothetical protein HRT81_08520 [Henriciella sp.]|nr:hypothetical protein [Henriciella sp.]
MFTRRRIMAFAVATALLMGGLSFVASFAGEGQADETVELERIEIAVKPFIARMADTRNLIVDLRPDRAIPEGYVLAGDAPTVDVDHESSTIAISGLFVFEPSSDSTLALRRADVEQSFEFGPPQPKVYQVSYWPEEARGLMARREFNFGPPRGPKKSEYLFIAPRATVTRDLETGTMRVALSLLDCVGGLTEPIDDDLIVGLNQSERTILVMGAFRFRAPTGAVPKFCRVNPENPKRVFEFENTEPGQYEIRYENLTQSRKRDVRPNVMLGRRQVFIDLPSAPSE